MTEQTMVDRLARALYDALEDDPWVGDFDDPTYVMVDGRVDFVVLARAGIEALRRTTPEMLRAGQGWDGIPAIWGRMIDAALEEGQEGRKP